MIKMLLILLMLVFLCDFLLILYAQKHPTFCIFPKIFVYFYYSLSQKISNYSSPSQEYYTPERSSSPLRPKSLSLDAAKSASWAPNDSSKSSSDQKTASQ